MYLEVNRATGFVCCIRVHSFGTLGNQSLHMKIILNFGTLCFYITAEVAILQYGSVQNYNNDRCMMNLGHHLIPVLGNYVFATSQPRSNLTSQVALGQLE